LWLDGFILNHKACSKLTVASDAGEIDWVRAAKATAVDLKLWMNRPQSY
jgi:hypothetical protein